jgi:hypothetical protein
MKTKTSRFLGSSAAVATAAILAFWFTFSSQAVRADDPGAYPPGQETMLVPVKTIDALEQRIKYLEESIAALTESWQHINTHRLCVSDDSGAETCITKAQLDSFLSKEAHVEISPPAASQEANAPSAAAPIESVAATEPSPQSEPAAVVGEKMPDQEPETTGTLGSAPSDAAMAARPEIEIYQEPAGRLDD